MKPSMAATAAVRKVLMDLEAVVVTGGVPRGGGRRGAGEAPRRMVEEVGRGQGLGPCRPLGRGPRFWTKLSRRCSEGKRWLVLREGLTWRWVLYCCVGVCGLHIKPVELTTC